MEGESLGEAFFLEMLQAGHPTESHTRMARVPRSRRGTSAREDTQRTVGYPRNTAENLTSVAE